MKQAVKSVAPNSIAEELGIAPGDVLLQINGETAEDVIDYEFYMAESQLVLLLRSPDGEEYEAEIEKEPYEDIGLVFEHDGFDRKIVCRNKCLFCFVDQMPKGLRKTLYVKDDDWRLSFLMGNYITLTNLSEKEIRRIIEKKISPLYVSVHASDDKVRTRLLGTERAMGTLRLIRRLVKSGIAMHTQIVMCEGINDGEVLARTVEDLYALYPGVLSVAVVPAGLTRHREGLAEIKPVSAENARHTVQIVETLQAKYLPNSGTRFVFAADEMYLQAGLPVPPYESYEAFDQIENGVGLVAKFLQESQMAMEEYAGAAAVRERIAVATGLGFYPYLCGVVQALKERFGVKAAVYGIRNDFFGETVTVTGLLTGRDIVAQLKGKLHGELLLLSGVCFRENSEVFLDDVSLAEIERELGVVCRKVPPDGYSFVEQLIDQEKWIRGNH